jgi:hypothetical protein
MSEAEWQKKGGTLTDGTAQKEYGLTREEILEAIRAGKLRYRRASIFGNPCLRLLRREVRALVDERRGRVYVVDREAKAEVARINRELKRLRSQIAAIEERKSEIMRKAQVAQGSADHREDPESDNKRQPNQPLQRPAKRRR